MFIYIWFLLTDFAWRLNFMVIVVSFIELHTARLLLHILFRIFMES